MFRWVILFLLVFAFDFYAFQAIKTVTKNRWIYILYWLVSIVVFANFMYYYFNFVRGNNFTRGHGYALAFLLTLFLPKLILVIALFGEDVVRCIRYIYGKLTQTNSSFSLERRKFLSQLALGVAAIPFTGFLYGITKGKYNFKVKRKTLYFKDLPEAFNGYTITQISDIHSGSLESKEQMAHGVAMVNAENSDVILFTGDIVNTKAEEMDEWFSIFDKLEAKDGKYAVLGNHDYGYYAYGDDPVMNEKNHKGIVAVHKKLGFDLLQNESRAITKNGQHINIVGVENWSASRHFPKRGSLEKATETIGANDFNILLSHDPSHFDYTEMELNKEDHYKHDLITNETNVINFKKPIALTLSGHTHGMQFGIEIPWLGIKWSPVKYRYPKWAGLYKENDKYLYVNRGFGYLAFPGRVGIWPEITVLTLKKAVDV